MVHAGLELPPRTAFASQLIRACPQPASAGSWWKCFVWWLSCHVGKGYREVRICCRLGLCFQRPDVAAHGGVLVYEGTLTTWPKPQPLYLTEEM